MKLLNLTVNPSGSIFLNLKSVNAHDFFYTSHAKEPENSASAYNNQESTLIVLNSQELMQDINEILPKIIKGITLSDIPQNQVSDLIHLCFSSFTESYRIGEFKPRSHSFTEQKKLKYSRNLSTYERVKKNNQSATELNAKVAEKEKSFLNQRFNEFENAVQNFVLTFNEFISKHYKSFIEDRNYKSKAVYDAMSQEQKDQVTELDEKGAILKLQLDQIKDRIKANEQAKFDIEKAVIIEQIKPEDPSADPVLAQVLEEIKEIQIKHKKSFF